VARRKTNGNLIIGKFIPSLNSIFVPYYGGELRFWDDIEILATNKKCKNFSRARLSQVEFEL